MTAQERESVLDRMKAAETRLFVVVEGLTPEQWHFRESPERWSIAENIEHLVAVERRILGGIQKSLATGAPAEQGSRAQSDADFLRTIEESRTMKIQAPEPLRPTGKWSEPGVLLAEFRNARSDSEKFTRETDGNLRGYGFRHIAFGEVDCYQWLILIAGHTDRHTHQIEGVKGHPEFPKA